MPGSCQDEWRSPYFHVGFPVLNWKVNVSRRRHRTQAAEQRQRNRNRACVIDIEFLPATRPPRPWMKWPLVETSVRQTGYRAGDPANNGADFVSGSRNSFTSSMVVIPHRSKQQCVEIPIPFAGSAATDEASVVRSCGQARSPPGQERKGHRGGSAQWATARKLSPVTRRRVLAVSKPGLAHGGVLPLAGLAHSPRPAKRTRPSTPETMGDARPIALLGSARVLCIHPANPPCSDL